MKLIQKIGLLVLFIIILMILGVLVLKYQTNYQENEDKLLLNELGEKRTQIQAISKESAFYEYLRSNLQKQLLLGEEGYREEIHHTEEEIQKVKITILESLADMDLMMKNLVNQSVIVDSKVIDISKTKEATAPIISNIIDRWKEFYKQVLMLVSEETTDKDRTLAFAYINDNNEELIQLSYELQEVVFTIAEKEAQVVDIMEIALIISVGVSVIISLIHLNQYVIVPFQTMYHGLSEIGITAMDTRVHLPTQKRVEPIVEDINSNFLKTNHLISLIENMNVHTSFPESLDFIYHKFSSFIPFNFIGLALFNEDKDMLKASYGVADDTIIGLPESIMGSGWLVEDTSLKQVIESGEARVINDLEDYLKDKKVNTYNQIILKAGIRSSITLPLKISGEPMGVIFFSSSSKNVYTEDHIRFLNTIVNSIAISFNQNIFIDELILSSILALAKLAESRDEDTGDHLERMKKYSRYITELLYENKVYPEEITLEYIEKIERFSPLHDIGKVGIADQILLKPDKLTTEEYEEMKNHAIYGADVMRAAESNINKLGRQLFTMGIDIAEGHHEKWDGSGYPYGKKGEEIPLSARIVAVADVFDALTSRRPYKDPFPFERAIEIIKEGRGKHFDPNIVDIFLEYRSHFERMKRRFHKEEGMQ